MMVPRNGEQMDKTFFNVVEDENNNVVVVAIVKIGITRGQNRPGYIVNEDMAMALPPNRLALYPKWWPNEAWPNPLLIMIVPMRYMPN